MRPELLIAGLYNAALPQGMGFLHYNPRPMTEEDARPYIGQHLDYLNGRAMKLRVNADGEIDDTFLYNKRNGADLAEMVISSLVDTEDPNNIFIQTAHRNGLEQTARTAREFVVRKTTTEDQDGVVTITLGADDHAEILERAINKAERGGGV